VLIEISEPGVGVAESIAKGAKEPRFARILHVEDYRYGVVLGVHSW